MSDRAPLASLFSPVSVAVIGATDREASVGRTVIGNLVDGTYKGRVYPVNPRRTKLFDRICYPKIGQVPEAVDLAIVVTPAFTVPGVVAECVAANAKALVVISAGFKEKGPEGLALEQQIVRALRGTTTRLLGPNCLGLMNPWIGLNATFAQDSVRPGNVAFLSQSGALLTAILDWSLVEHVGFSAIVSTGSMLEVGWGDLITFLGEDPRTEAILLYMESIGDARAFLSAAREVALSKPIIVIKAGRSQAASRAAASHTGALTGSDEVHDAAFRRCGVLRVDRIADIFHMAEVLSKQPRPRGRRLMILTNAGGPGVLATDALMATGGELAEISEDTLRALNSLLPSHWSHGNPVDVLGDADPDRYERALELAIQDPNNDGLLAILAPQGMTDPAGMAERLKPHAKIHGKPLLASWMGGKSVAKGVEILNAAGVPTFSYPDTAARAFTYMWRYADNVRALYETPFVADDLAGYRLRRDKTGELIERAVNAGRTLLSEIESKEILATYGIPTVPTRLARDEEEALRKAEELGYPVVLKVHSEIITHKTEVEGVKLNLAGPEDVRRAYRAIQSAVLAKKGKDAFLGVSVQPMIRPQGYELIVGSSVDSQFGPVILFGSGGQLVEVYRDRSLALPPLNTTLAQRLMEQTRVYAALQGVRGRKSVDLAALGALLVRFSDLVVEQPRIREIDINPLFASPEGLLALDARIVLFGGDVKNEELPRPAIRPYPVEYVSRWKMKGGSEVVVRPIRPEDEPLMVEFHKTLSDSTVYLRYFHMQKLEARVAHDRLIRKCFIDYDREIALIAEHADPQNGRRELLGVGRLTRQRAPEDAELGVLVTDRCQGQGLGTELLRQLIAVARKERVHRVLAHILAENAAMIALARHFHFQIVREDDPSSLIAVLAIDNRRQIAETRGETVQP
ncbi:MAG TPA: bifunctional acetate--CoA ligase family protein/GNAT family N-acetyltransferase [Candidatus Methylomirabilis sp.]|nr:bifunctional acetate--CoA ligase family protein/GNAT family N-acetyltransferase [Candidatus Methylomirabilis sp.]